MTQESHSLLQKPIQSLDVSFEFKAMAMANEFQTLEEILREPLHELPFKRQSGYRLLKEILDVLEENHLSGFIED